MMKETKQRYLANGHRVSLKQLYQLGQPVQGKKGSSFHPLCHGQRNSHQDRLRPNRNNKSEWLAILSTDQTLTEKEIIQIYGMRWDIEVFFKTTKYNTVKTPKGVPRASYDVLISHTTIVFVRYFVLSWQNRCHTD